MSPPLATIAARLQARPAPTTRIPRMCRFSTMSAISRAYETSQRARAARSGVDQGSTFDGNAITWSAMAAYASHARLMRRSPRAAGLPPRTTPTTTPRIIASRNTISGSQAASIVEVLAARCRTRAATTSGSNCAPHEDLRGGGARRTRCQGGDHQGGDRSRVLADVGIARLDDDDQLLREPQPGVLGRQQPEIGKQFRVRAVELVDVDPVPCQTAC